MIKEGDKVKVHYVGKLENNTVFDSSIDRGEPLQIVIGKGQVIRGFESSLIGKNLGDKVSITIEPKDGYGPVREDLVISVPKSNAPEGVEVGSALQTSDSNDGRSSIFIVKEISSDTITIDGNHPLAGKTILFDIEVIDIQ